MTYVIKILAYALLLSDDLLSTKGKSCEYIYIYFLDNLD